MYNYKTYLILESKKRDSKIEKQKEKIRKFFKFEPLIDLIFEIVVDKDTTKGLQYTIWFSNVIKNYFLDHLMNRYKTWNQIEYLTFMDKKSIENTFDNYLKTGEIKFQNFPNEKQLKIGKPKGEFTDEKMKNFKDKLIKTIDNSYTWIGTQLKSNIQVVSDWLKSPLREEEKVDLSKYNSLEDAAERAKEWHDNIKASGVVVNEKGTIIMTFPDGYYWIDLGTNSCEDEGKAMGHCATTNADTLYSLRKKQSPHVTAAILNNWSSVDNTTPDSHGKTESIIKQMKGRGNNKPSEKYHTYIVELLAFPNVSDSIKILHDMHPIIDIELGEYQPENDFHISDLTVKRIKYLYDNNSILMENQINLAIKNKLLKEGELSKEEFVKNYKDLKIINGQIHFILHDWTDFDKTIFKDHKGRNGGWQESVLDFSAIDDWYYDDNFDYNFDWAYVEERAFKEIIETCDTKGYEIYYDVDDNADHELLLTKENMKVVKKDNEQFDITITTPEGVEISFKSLLIETRKIISTGGQIEYWHNDNLEDIKVVLNDSKNMSQALADENEAFRVVTDAIGDKLGGIAKNEESEHGGWSDGIHFWIDLNYISEIENASGEKNKSVIDIINTLGYDSEGYDDDESELLIECEIPYYGWDGEITPDTFSEELINRLGEL